MSDIASIAWGTWAQAIAMLGILILLATRLPPPRA